MRIAVLMSGGVDSSVSAFFLKKEGHNVFGIHMVHLQEPDERIFEIAKKIGIEVKIVDLRKIFKTAIVDYFVNEYKMGRTPNPCYFCNRIVKFGFLFDVADKMGADLIASGHYARVINGKLYKAVDKKKDQSYFLSSIRRNLFKRIIFPLGEMKKEEVKKIASSIGLEFESESQDVCFLKGKNLRDFLIENGVRPGKGKFVYRGEVVGENDGYAFYTIGQRKGLGVSLGKRVYVAEIIPKSNTVVLGDKEDVMYDMMVVRDLNFLEDVPESFEAEVKIRSNFDPVKCEVKVRGDTALVRFEKKVFAVTPGQIAVFYWKDQVIASGVIEKGVKR